MVTADPTVISVLIATRDRPRLLADALESLRGQQFEAWEALIVDSGQSSSAESTVHRFSNSRFRYFRWPVGLGECEARNIALQQAIGDYVCYLDDDDELPANSLAWRLDIMRERPGCGMVYGDYRLISLDDAGASIRESIPVKPACYTKSYYDKLVTRLTMDTDAIYALLKRFNFVRGGTPLMKRAAVIAVGGFDNQLLRYGDYDLWLKLARRYPIYHLDKVVYNYRFHRGCNHRLLSDSLDEQMVLRVCKRHRIRQSVQWAHHQSAIRELWQNEIPATPHTHLCDQRLATTNEHHHRQLEKY